MAPVFEVLLEVLEVEQAGAVVGWMLCEYKSVYLDEGMRRQMEMREVSGSSVLFVPDQDHPFLLFRCSKTCSCS